MDVKYAFRIYLSIRVFLSINGVPNLSVMWSVQAGPALQSWKLDIVLKAY